jgi:hypothetical protein
LKRIIALSLALLCSDASAEQSIFDLSIQSCGQFLLNGAPEMVGPARWENGTATDLKGSTSVMDENKKDVIWLARETALIVTMRLEFLGDIEIRRECVMASINPSRPRIGSNAIERAGGWDDIPEINYDVAKKQLVDIFDTQMTEIKELDMGLSKTYAICPETAQTHVVNYTAFGLHFDLPSSWKVIGQLSPASAVNVCQ